MISISRSVPFPPLPTDHPPPNPILQPTSLTPPTSALIYPSIYRISISHHALRPHPTTLPRTFSSLALLLLYTIQTALFGVRLTHWSPNTPRNCFSGHTLLHPNAHSRFHHNFTLSVLAVLFIFPFLFTLYLAHSSQPLQNGAKFRKNRWFLGLFTLSLLLISLHASFIHALKSADQHFLPPGDEEDKWGFGQIVVMFSFVPMVFQIYVEVRREFGGAYGDGERERVQMERWPRQSLYRYHDVEGSNL